MFNSVTENNRYKFYKYGLKVYSKTFTLFLYILLIELVTYLYLKTVFCISNKIKNITKYSRF